MVAPNAAALLRRNAGRNPLTQGLPGGVGIATRVHLRFGAQTWTDAEFFDESCRFAHLFVAWRRAADPAGERQFHVAILSDNTPDYLFAFGGAALAEAAIVGLNPTRRGEHLARDLAHTHCLALLVDPQHLALLERLRGENVFRPFTVADEARLRIAFEAAGRERFWEL